LRRNICKFPEEIKKRAHEAIVRPNVEYTSSAWDPYQEDHIKKIEMVQRSARFIRHQYSRELGSVIKILKDLKLPSLEIRRKIKRLCLFHKAFHHQAAINIPDYIKQ
jgi:heme oxygenase